MSGRKPQDVQFRGVDFNRPAIAHFVGLAGSGMRSLARVLAQKGWTIRGSDVSEEACRELAAVAPKFEVFESHDPRNVTEDATVVVYSDAVDQANPEVQRASELSIATFRYAEVLGRLMWERTGIAIAGTHGKSTTTAMLSDILVADGRDPTVVFGAAPIGDWCGGRSGDGGIVLVEACEYNANFLNLFPAQAAILGIEPDHFDCYRDLDDLRHAFALFAGTLPRDGLLLTPHGCRVTASATGGVRCRVETFGEAEDACWSIRDVDARDGRFAFALHRLGKKMTRLELHAPGRHNMVNATVAAALAWENGVDLTLVRERLATFRGLHRRMEVRGVFGGVAVIDDYAHHPTAAAASLATTRRVFPERTVWCVFQPHQASRTERLLKQLAMALATADHVVLTPIYAAREKATETRVTEHDLARAVQSHGGYVKTPESTTKLLDLLIESTSPGDVVLFMGAGDIPRVTHEFIQRIRTNRAAV